MALSVGAQLWRPIAEFDPPKPTLVHDKLNDQVIDWEPDRHGKEYQASHRDFGDGVIEWDDRRIEPKKKRRPHGAASVSRSASL